MSSKSCNYLIKYSESQIHPNKNHFVKGLISLYSLNVFHTVIS